MSARNLTSEDAAQLGYELACQKPETLARILHSMAWGLRNTPDQIQRAADILQEEAKRHLPKGACCYRDHNSDGNCDIHAAPGVLRAQV